MYADWAEIDLNSAAGRSVLEKFSATVGKSVASSVVGELAKSVQVDPESLHQGQSVVSLEKDKDVQWAMQVVCYGLGLSFATDYETIRSCVKLYTSWLTCLRAEPHASIPRAITEQPCHYVRTIIEHLHHLFVPRFESGLDNQVMMRQAKEAHYVLRCVQTLVMQSRMELQDELWPEVLKFMLRINDSLLSIPYEAEDISVQLCSRVLGVLFELWLQACGNGQFPSPSYWKTFKSLCARWRHRVALVDHWAETVMVLTRKLLAGALGDATYVEELTEEKINLVPRSMSEECLQQCWFRFLYLMGNPAEIPNFELSSKFREFVARFGPEKGILEPAEHPCLSQLPFCFFRAMSAVSCFVGIFLGEKVECSFPGPEKLIKDLSIVLNPLALGNHPQSMSQGNMAPSLVRNALGIPSVSVKRESKDAPKTAPPIKERFNVNHLPASSLVYGCLKAKPLTFALDSAPYRVNESRNIGQILDLFGEWLYGAATIKVQGSSTPEDARSVVSVGSLSESESTGRSSSDVGHRDLMGVSGIQAGRAEAVGCLCKIFCAKRGDSGISELHTVKFFAVLLECLVQKESVTLSSLIFHGVNLFRLDLRGLELLVPNFLDAIEHVLIAGADKSKLHPSISDNELRRACLHHYSAMISLPTHYGTSAIADLTRTTEQHTFIGMRPKILRSLIYVLRHETDSVNLQLALSLCALFCLESWQWERKMKFAPSDGYCLQAVKTVISVICEQLCHPRWIGDNAVSAAALDALSTLATLSETHKFDDDKLYIQLVATLCQLIETQLSRPPPYHSRDLHSGIVSAFMCVQTWITALPSLMKSEVCLGKVAETIELGISGSKGQPVSAGAHKKPASQRVHDAAEQLLYCLFCQVGSEFQTLSVVNDENSILEQLKQSEKNAGDRSFHYFLLDNSAVMGFLELTGTDESGYPQVAAVLRSPYYGIRSWTFTLRPRAPDKEVPVDWVSRPEGTEPTKSSRPNPAFFPADLEKIPKCKADLSIPPLKLSAEAEKLKPLIREAIEKEKWSQAKIDLNLTRDVKPPAPTIDCKIGRVLLSDLGYLDPDRIGHDCLMLNSDAKDFMEEMSVAVDGCPCRMVQTVHIFYVAKGQSDAAEILENGAKIEETSAGFCGLLSRLGTGLEVKGHRQWTGHWATAYKTSDFNVISEDKVQESYRLDGMSHFLFWSTPSVEVAFLVPTETSTRFVTQQRAKSTPPPDSLLTASNKSYNLPLLTLSGENYLNSDENCQGKTHSRRRSQSFSPEEKKFIRIFATPNTVAAQKTKEVFKTERNGESLATRSSNDLIQVTENFMDESSSIKSSRSFSFVDKLQQVSPTKKVRGGIFKRFGANKKSSAFGDPGRPPLIVVEADESPPSVSEPPLMTGTGYSMLPPSDCNLETKRVSAPDSFSGCIGDGGQSIDGPLPAPVRPPRSKSVSTESDFGSSKIGGFGDSLPGKAKKQTVYQDHRILVVWLEKFEDHTNFPLKDLLPATDIGEEKSKGMMWESTFLIFVHRLTTGLCRIKLQGPWGKLGFSGPLTDGSVVSEALLSVAIGETVVNIGRRRCLEQEGYVLPHVRRKQRIQEFGSRFRKRLNSTDLLMELLTT